MRITSLAGAMAGVVGGVLAATLSLPALGQGKPETVRVQDYPGIGNMLIRIAATKGYCEEHGITCALKTIINAPLGVQALLARDIDVAFVPPEVQIAAMRKGAALKIIASGDVLAPLEIVVSNRLPAPHASDGYPAFMADLKGKRIGMPARGGAFEFQFYVLAEEAGLKPEDFTFVAVGSPNTAYGALISNQVDAEMSFEPSGSLCDVLKTCRTIWRASDSPKPARIYATNGASSNFVVTEETLKTHPKTVEAVIAAAEDAEAFIQDPKNFKEALAIAQSYFRFDMPRGDEVMEAALKRAVPAYKAAVSRPALKAIADYMLSTKQIDAPFDTTTMVYAKAP
jgi:NitT/TauT family transport system substrate-binding protein